MTQVHETTAHDDRSATTGPRAGFWRAEDGSFIIFGLFLFILILTAGGLAVDLMRYEAQRARLQSTLDRAVLAAASMDQPLDAKDVVMDYFTKAGLGDYISRDDIDVETTLTSRRVSATASMDVNMSLLKFSGVEMLSAPAAGAAEESASQTEISLIVDVSGSMGYTSSSGNSKIYELREAAKDFANIVLCNPEDSRDSATCTIEPGKVSVSLIPYSEQVLAGEDLLSHMLVTDEHSYSSCITFSEDDFSDVALDPYTQYLRTGHFDPWSDYRSNRSSSKYTSSLTCRTDSWRQIRPLVYDAPTLRGYIGQLGASGNTSIDLGMKWGMGLLDETAQPIVEGMIEDGNINAAFQDRPIIYTQRGVEKVIVLMTDGQNTSQHYLYDGFRSGPSPFYVSGTGKLSVLKVNDVGDPNDDEYYWVEQGEWHDHPYGSGTYEKTVATQVCETVWYQDWWGRWRTREECHTEYSTETVNDEVEGDGYSRMTYPELWATYNWDYYNSFSWLSTPGSSWGTSTKNTRLDAACDIAKANDITIFTVGFEVPDSYATVMESCASSPSHYFDVDGLDVAEAFAAIAREISKLRLVN